MNELKYWRGNCVQKESSGGVQNLDDILFYQTTLIL